jgi:hypothetical protein
MPSPPPTLYSVALFDPAGQRQFRFLVVPDRAHGMEVRNARQIAELLEVGEWRGLEPVQAWSLPFLLDAITGRYGDTGYPFRFEIFWRDVPGYSRGPTEFAQYAVFAPVIPVEASPVRGRSIAALLTTGGATGAMTLYGATGDAAAGLYVAGVTIFFTAAYPVFLRLEAAVARLMDVELERPARDDEP